MLTIPVESDDHVGAAIKREGKTSAERGTLPTIDRMTQHPNGVGGSHRACRIGGSVVHNDDLRIDRSQAPQRIVQTRPFVVSGNHHPHTRPGRDRA